MNVFLEELLVTFTLDDLKYELAKLLLVPLVVILQYLKLNKEILSAEQARCLCNCSSNALYCVCKLLGLEVSHLLKALLRLLLFGLLSAFLLRLSLALHSSKLISDCLLLLRLLLLILCLDFRYIGLDNTESKVIDAQSKLKKPSP